jgi:DHA1 family bicyclomycin/chloramphenicol resistance-like MFS transporter
LFTFLAASSFVFVKQFGLSKTHYGLLMMSMSFSYIVGTFICRRLLKHLSGQRCVALASCCTLTGGISLTVLAYVGQDQAWYGPWAVMVPVYLFMLPHGVHQPCGQSGAVTPFPHIAGTASALNGFLMMLGAFFMGSWLGAHMDQPVFALAHGMLLWSLCIGLLAWTWVRRLPTPGA